MHPREIRIVRKLSAIVESETLGRDHLRSRREPPPRVHTNVGVHITTTDITAMTTSLSVSKGYAAEASRKHVCYLQSRKCVSHFLVSKVWLESLILTCSDLSSGRAGAEFRVSHPCTWSSR